MTSDPPPLPFPLYPGPSGSATLRRDLVAAFAFVGTGACLLPAAMALLLPPLRRLGERLGLLALPLAGGALARSLSRTGGAASALGVALAMTIGVITMVKSFESEVRRWIDGAIRADLFISDVNEHLAREDARVPESALRELAAMPEVEALDTLRKIVASAGVGPQDVVLEVGPGLGGLTLALAERARSVIAVEIDRNLIPPLGEVLAGAKNVRLVQGDILEIEPADLIPPEEPYLVVANIPYYITSAITRHLLESAHPPRRLARRTGGPGPLDDPHYGRPRRLPDRRISPRAGPAGQPRSAGRRRQIQGAAAQVPGTALRPGQDEARLLCLARTERAGAQRGRAGRRRAAAGNRAGARDVPAAAREHP